MNPGANLPRKRASRCHAAGDKERPPRPRSGGGPPSIIDRVSFTSPAAADSVGPIVMDAPHAHAANLRPCQRCSRPQRTQAVRSQVPCVVQTQTNLSVHRPRCTPPSARHCGHQRLVVWLKSDTVRPCGAGGPPHRFGSTPKRCPRSSSARLSSRPNASNGVASRSRSRRTTSCRVDPKPLRCATRVTKASGASPCIGRGRSGRRSAIGQLPAPVSRFAHRPMPCPHILFQEREEELMFGDMKLGESRSELAGRARRP